jgi:hypothetical protein
MFPSVPNKSVRVVSDAVVIGGIHFKIHDRSVGGLDDPVYEGDRDVWESVPRGQSAITVDDVVVARIHGLRKFGYAGAPFGTPDAVETVVLIDKMNGECAHIGAFEHDGVPYWIAGSKHVHIFWRADHYAEDIAAYSAQRYKYALKVAALWSSWLSSAPVEQRAGLFDYLSSTGYTACAEAILAESEHIVEYTDKDVLVFYALADETPSSAGLTATTPQHALTDLARFGLRVAPASAALLKGSAEYTAALDAVARRSNSEGVVAYGISACGAVCCMWKEKSYPYVVERVVREAVIHGRNRAQITARVRDRLAEQDISVRAYFAEWEATRFPWLLDFADWLRTAGVLPTKNGWEVQSRWLTLQRTFLTTPDWRASAATGGASAATAAAAGPCVVMFVGIPGSGKSTAARSLYKLLVDAGQKPCWLNQDEAASNRSRFLAAVKAAAADSSITHILLDKVNLESGNRADYTELGLTPTLTVVYGHPDGAAAYKAVCADRFGARGNAHRCLHSTGAAAVDRSKFLRICDAMLAKAKEPSTGESEILTVDIRSPASAVVESIASKIGLGVDAAACDAAVAFSAAYEAALSADAEAKRAKPMYGGLSTAQAAILPLVPADALTGKTLRPEFHITLRYIGDTMDPVWYMAFLSKIGSHVPIKITEIVWDAKGAAARVELPADVACSNAVPHITLAVAKGVQPVYSNTLLLSADAHRVAVDLTLDAAYFFG